MSKDVKNTYSRKKSSGSTAVELAFDEAKRSERRKSVDKFPNGVPYALSPKSKIWCKIGPHSPKKDAALSPEKKKEVKGRKRKLQYGELNSDSPGKPYDPFGFSELEEDVDILSVESESLESSNKRSKKTAKIPSKCPAKKSLKLGGSPKRPLPSKSTEKSKPVKGNMLRASPHTPVKGRKEAKATKKSIAPRVGRPPSKKTNQSKQKVVKSLKGKVEKSQRAKKRAPEKRSPKSPRPPGKKAKVQVKKTKILSPKGKLRIAAVVKGAKDTVQRKRAVKAEKELPDVEDHGDKADLDLSIEEENIKQSVKTVVDGNQTKTCSVDVEEASPPLSLFSTKKAILPAKLKGKNPSAVRVNRHDKQLFTIVKNTKQAHECSESGESQLFLDDVNDLLDGMKPTCSSKMRCLSAIELVTKSASSSFRLSLRAHGYVEKIFSSLQDSTADPGLALCTAAIMFMLTRDRLNIDFNKTILDLLLRLLAVKAEVEEKLQVKEFGKVKTSVRNVLLKANIKGVEALNLSSLSASLLAQQSLLSISSQRTGEWFKDEIRLLGGLDHIVDTVLELNNHYQVKGANFDPLSKPETVIHIERCMKLLENVTFKSKQNQAYLFSVKEGALLDTTVRILKGCGHWLASYGTRSSSSNHQKCLMTTLRLLLNLTHDNEQGTSKFCHLDGAIRTILETGLQTSEYVAEDKRFDALVLSLGLLINLVEHSCENLRLLNTAAAPPYHEFQGSTDEFASNKNDFSTVHALMQLFLVKAEAARDSTMLCEELPDLNTTISHNTTLRLGPDGLSLYCEEKEEEEEEKTAGTGAQKGTRPKNKKADKKNIGEALKKAGQHMEDSFVASYAALLLGLLSQENKENRELIHSLLPAGNFTIMVETLTEFLNFTTMTSAAEWSGMEAIKEVLSVFKDCQKDYHAQA